MQKNVIFMSILYTYVFKMDKKWKYFIWLMQECEKKKLKTTEGLRMLNIKDFATKWKQTNRALGSKEQPAASPH